MICNYCGLKNDKENKYCINCGVELAVDEISDLINCSKCGFENNCENKFCVSCRNKLQDKKQKVHYPQHQHTKSSKQRIREERNKSQHEYRKANRFNSKSLKIFWITTGVLMAAVLLPTTLIPILNQNPDIKEIPVELKSTNPVVETKVYEIASKFVCSCGSCNEESLELCKCERAVEERQFIRDYLEQNQKTDDIVIAVANKFGWIKAEFASNFNIDSSRIWSPSVKLITKDLIPNDATNIVSNLESIPWNTVCPIKGEKIDPSVKTVVFDGKTYGFCCAGCDAEFLSDPEKYSKNLNDNGTRFIKG